MLQGVVDRVTALPSGVRWALGIFVGLLGLNLLAFAIDRILGGASPGPTASSYTTDGAGTAAYAELLQRERRVERLREEPSSADLDPSDTVFVLAPDDVTEEDAAEFASFVEEGGRLIVAVAGDADWLGDIISDPPVWTEEGYPSSHPFVPVAETADVSIVVGSGSGAWSDAGASLPILGGARATVSAASSGGEGRMLFLADPSILENEFLDNEDNAAFALGLAGDAARTAVFAETFHGYSQAKGFSALPATARWALLLLGLVTLVLIASSARRFGPPDQRRRDLPPARREYVDALASSLAKMKDKDAAVRPLRSHARSVLAERLGASDNASDEELIEAARAHGDREAVEILLKPVRDERDVIGVGRAAVKLTGGKR